VSSGRLVGASAGTVVDMLAAAMVIAGIVVEAQIQVNLGL